MRTVRNVILLACAGWLLSFLLVPASQAAQAPGQPAPHPAALFQTSKECLACHNSLTTPAGEDVSIGSSWRSSMMANSSRDPYWHASVRRETIDHPSLTEEIEDECSVCHMPMARTEAVAGGRKGEIFAHLPIGRGATAADALAADGVSCTLCHQIQDDKLGTPESFTGGYVVDTTQRLEEPPIFGPFTIDPSRVGIMRSATGFRPTEASYVRQSELCATCHTLYTQARGPNGEVVGRLPEQVPYLEWQHSAYRGERTCQSCHMPQVEQATPITSVLGEPRDGLARHGFRGGNFFMLRMLNRYRADLGVEALPAELERAAGETVHNLQSLTAEIGVEGVELAASGRLEFDVAVRNLVGHKLPTGYPSRRVWLHVTVRDGTGRSLFESGALRQDGSIEGNDGDIDPANYEPHYSEIRSPSEVQIYESVMADAARRPTTGLLTAVQFVKDNRLLPRGFEKSTAHADVAVHGSAAQDDDFTAGGDRVAYAVDVAGAAGGLRIEAELWYQPIAFRWAANLQPYRAAETQRFVSYFQSMSTESAALLARSAVEAR